MNKKVAKKRYKLKYKSLIVVLVLLILIMILIFSFLNIRLKNIYISGNTIISDQDIIEYLGLEDYPKVFTYTTSSLKKSLNKNIYVKDSKIKRLGLTGIEIEIEENYPLFFDQNKNKTVLLNGDTTDKLLPAPTLINYVPDKKYELLKEKFVELDRNILNRISEIEYKPNEVDDELFLLKMNDSNYVYITLLKTKSLNQYITIIKNFQGKKGVLYLDSGEYFKVLEG